MQDKPYLSLMDKICRSNGWVLGADRGETVVGIPQGGGQQSVVVTDFQDSTGQFAIRLWAPVAPADKIPPEQALEVNYALPHGCLATKEGQVVLTATRIWNLTNQADLTNLLSILAYYADFYGKHYNR